VLNAPLRSEHPLWMCAFRSFFFAGALAAPLLIGLWIAFLALGLPLPAVSGGPFVWHAHELIFGFALAAVAGFALTAIPEFTHSAAFDRGPVRSLAGLWLLGRAAFWSSGLFGMPALLLAALAHLGLLGGLALLLAPRLWRDPERRHLAFLWALGALTACVAGFYIDVLAGAHPARWLHAALGVLMMLIVVAMSRISMRIVNGAIDETGIEGVEYRARPPRRNLAIFCIGLYTAAELLAPGTRLAGWLALAAAAALFHLLNDWHVGRALFRRWPFMLYGVYALMAAGYALMGVALIVAGDFFSAGRHLLTVGAMGLNIYLVMCIAGRMHSGRPLDERPWVPLGAALIVVAALLRTGGTLPGAAGGVLLTTSGLLWSTAFALCAWHMAPLWLAPRTDGGIDCEGLLDP
jgi:uncharacterized protein involved in response to NO